MQLRDLALAVMLALACYGQDLKDRNLKVNTDANPSGIAGHVPRGYAVIVGITHYQSVDAAGLQFPESDAEAVYRVLISQQGGAFPAENVHKLLGKDATLANMRHEIEDWLPSVAQPEDRVIVYFAGHGVVSRGRGYLAPWDVALGRIEETAYPMQTLGNVLANRVKARWKALFADACHSGKINAETTDEGIAEQLDSTASQYLSLTATLGQQKSYEDPALAGGFGLFSHFLVEGLKGNADNSPCDGVVTADELVEYVRTEVRNYAAKHGVQQTPHANSDYEPAMPMGVSLRCGSSNLDASASGSAVIETLSDGVEVFVDDDLVGTATKDAPLNIPGLAEGPHIIKANKAGYKPEIQQIMVVRGRASTVTIRMRFPITVKRQAEVLEQQGDKLLRSQHSTMNPLMTLGLANSQTVGNIRKARDLFTRALQEDPGYSLAAYDLGVANQVLGEQAASKAAFQRAIELDPSYVQARMEYADRLMADGDADEAVRQLVEAARFEPGNDAIHARMAGAYWEKSSWQQCVAEAGQALRVNPQNIEASFRHGDCLRELAVEEASAQQKTTLFGQARDSYQAFVKLTNFSTPVLSWMAFHFIGSGAGSRHHADRKDTYKQWRDQGYLGLCICEKNLGNLLRAREDCNRAVSYEPEDAMAHYFLANVDRDLFNATKSCDSAKAARASYQKVVALNPNLAEARNAIEYLKKFEALSDALHRRGCVDF
jgi:tetratricopeptide (TPR) repeat protein